MCYIEDGYLWYVDDGCEVVDVCYVEVCYGEGVVLIVVG